MIAYPPNLEEGQYTTKIPHFNGQYYDRWKTQNNNFIMDEYSELWDIICYGPHIPMR